MVDREETQEKGAAGEDSFWCRLCWTVGAELWRGKGWILGGGVAGGDRGEHAGSLLKCQSVYSGALEKGA